MPGKDKYKSVLGDDGWVDASTSTPSTPEADKYSAVLNNDGWEDVKKKDLTDSGGTSDASGTPSSSASSIVPDVPLNQDWQSTSPQIAGAGQGVATGTVPGAPSISTANQLPESNNPQSPKYIYTINRNKSSSGVNPGMTEEDKANIKQETLNSATYLHNYLAQNLDKLPLQYQQQASGNPVGVGNPIHDISDPHGDYNFTGQFVTSQVNSLTAERDNELAQKKLKLQADPNYTIEDYNWQSKDARDAYDAKAKQLKAAGDHTVELQLFNKNYQDNNLDPTLLGIQFAKATGDPKTVAQANEDERLYNTDLKSKINPAALYSYQLKGKEVIDNGTANAAANDQTAVAEIGSDQSHAAASIIKKDNAPIIKAAKTKQIADYIYNNESGLYGTLYSHNLTQQEIDEAGGKLGINTKGITPQDVPSSLSLLGNYTKGLLNSSAPLYEGFWRGLAGVGIADHDAVNERFKPGWENNSGLASGIGLGETPQGQQQFTNVRGILGNVFHAGGDLTGFIPETHVVAKGLQAAGMGEIGASKLANGIVGAIPAFNQAYNKSLEFIGDKPEDEGKRLLYSSVIGAVTGAIMNIDPKSEMFSQGTAEAKTTSDLLKYLKDTPLEELTKPELESRISQAAIETAKHTGLQMSIGASTKIAENITDNIFDPKAHKDITEGAGQAAITAGISMFLPSMFAGISHPENQTTINKGILWEAATNDKKYRDAVFDQYQKGNLTKDEALQAHDNILKAKNIVNNDIPGSINGTELTTPEKQAYAWSLLKESALQEKLDQINGKEKPDKAQAKIIQGQIAEGEKERADILLNSGKNKPIEKPSAPTKENQINEEIKEPKSENNTIPLSPQTNENEKEIIRDIDQNGGQNSPNAQNGRTEAEEAADGEKRDEHQEGGLLSHPEVAKPNNINKGEETPPLAVPKTPAEKKAAEIEAKRKKLAPHLKITPSENLNALDDGEAAGLPEKEADKQVDDAIINNPDKPVDINIANEEPHGESFNDHKNEVKNEWENIKDKAQDNTLVVTHSSVINLIKHAEGLDGTEAMGWDHPDLNEKYAKDNTEPPALQEVKIPGKDGQPDKTIWLARHGETEEGKEGIRRTKDADLTDKGRKEAEDIAVKLLKEKGVTPPEIIHSDLPRAKETADIIAEHLQQEKPTENAADIIANKINEEQNATPQSKEPQQEGNPDGAGKPDLPDKENDTGRQRDARIKAIDARIEEEHKARTNALSNPTEWHKANNTIEKLTAEKEAILKAEKDEAQEVKIKAGYGKIADKIREIGKKAFNPEAERGMLGSFPVLNPKNARKFIDALANLVEKGANIHIAILKLINRAKAEFGDTKGELNEGHLSEIKDFLDNSGIIEYKKKPPVFAENEKDLEEVASDYQDAIDNGDMTHAEVMQEITDLGLKDEAESKIADFIDWYTTGKDARNRELRQPKYEKNYLNEYGLSQSGQTSKYLSGETLQDVHGKEVQFDIDSKETQLQKEIVQDSANMVGLAKMHSGSNDVLDFGPKMLENINKIPDDRDNSVKKLLATTGLHNELHAELTRLEDELKLNPDKKAEIEPKMRQVNKMIAQTELLYRDITSKASETMNAARANRVFRNTYYHDLYADKILSEQQQKEKQETEEALVKTNIPDKIAKDGPIKPQKKAEEEIKNAIEQKDNSQASQDNGIQEKIFTPEELAQMEKEKEEPIPAEKSAEKSAEKGEKAKSSEPKGEGQGKKEKQGDQKPKKNKKEKTNTRKEVLTKEEAEKKANEILNGESFEDLLKKAKEQTKKPC